LLLIAGCSAETDTATTTEPSPAVSSTVATITPEETSTTTTTVAVDSESLLSDAMAAYAEGYEFTATTTLNGEVATTQSGRWLNGASQTTVVSGDGEVEYLITAEGQWARLPGGEWEELEGTAASAHPLAALAAPDSLEVVESTAKTTIVLARYPAAALELAGDPVDATLTFTDGALVGVAFDADVDGNKLESATLLGPLLDATPITSPS